MTSERHQAYKHALQLIDRQGAAALHKDEDFVLRDAAEEALLSPEPSADLDNTLAMARSVLTNLGESERGWTTEAADELYEAIAGCAPAADLALV